MPTATSGSGVAEIDLPNRSKSELSILFKHCVKKESCQIYPTVSSEKHGDCPIGGYHKSSRKAGTFCMQLGNNNQGPVGLEYDKGLYNGISHHALSGLRATPPKVQSGATVPCRSGATKASGQGSSSTIENNAPEQLPFNFVSGTKERWGLRPVINLKRLNTFVVTPHFEMEGIQTFKSLAKRVDWLVKVDMKDAYFSVSIHRDHRKYLCFSLREKSYQFTCLPFGLTSAPWVFTKTLKPIAALGRELGFRLVIYIDNILLMAELTL